MATTFDPKNLVTLPRFTALSLATLLQQLLARAKKEGVPKAAREAHDDLHAAHKALNKALKKQLTPTTAITTDQIAADREEDAAFGALCRWARAFAELVGTEEAKVADRLLGHVFPTGLDFTQLSFAEEWQAGETRLALIAEQHLDQDIQKLGGGIFLERIKKAHKQYGEALGITTGRTLEAAPAGVRDDLEAARGALRAYVLVVSGTVIASKAKTSALAASLLEPFTTFESPVVNAPKEKKHKKSKGDDAPAVAPDQQASDPTKQGV